MNKKLLYILFTLFLTGILSVSCSNADKTGAEETINKYKGTIYHSENNDGRYVSINEDGSITIKVNDTADEFPKDLVKHLSGTKYTYTPEPQFEDIYTIEFLDNGSRIVLIYGSKDHPLYFKK
ncbi:hypothetical protein R4K54_13395 [Brachyspira murdochii]|uniref:Lipoprotein n=2 Tax=Brachyspira murdochii TaxID=84378 RepID=A0ABX5B870_9SPIR|nr:hypothetical protein [Brachyspira murdochii]PPS22522.1 hypothetical protein DJ52_04550 [Brachyspira murdochii]